VASQPRLLANLNRLPASALNLQPSLLHTRPFLVLPSTAKSSSHSPKPLLPPEEERTRLLVRRFQVAAKCVDDLVAKVCIDQVLERRKQEASFVWQNAVARGGVQAASESDFGPRQGGEVEEALEAWHADSRDVGAAPTKVKGVPTKGWTGIRFATRAAGEAGPSSTARRT
jgi:hypothetical protein